MRHSEAGGPLTMSGTAETVHVGTRALAVLFAALVPAHLVLLDGAARWTMAGVALVAALVALAGTRVARTAGDRLLDGLLLGVCLLPIAFTLLLVAVTGHLEHSALVMLGLVAVGAVMTRATTALVVLVATVLAWLLLVLVVRPEPVGLTGLYVEYVVLACALSCAVFAVRTRVARRLHASQMTMSRHVMELQSVRGQLEGSLRQFRNVFDDSPVAIGLADERGVYVQVNDALCRLLARAPEQVLHRSSREFTHPDDLGAHARASALVRTSPEGVARVEKRYVRPNGEVRWVDLTFARVAGPNGQPWTLAHLVDVTDRRTADQELALTRDTLWAAAEIARVTQLGGDPRPVVLEHLQTLAGAASVTILEPMGPDRLVVTAASGQPNLVGIGIDLDEPSATVHVWKTGEPLFASRTVLHPAVSPRLLQISGASSMLWQPVGLGRELRAVLALVWDETSPEVTTVQRTSIEVLAAETGAALTGERLRRQLEVASITDPLTGLLNRRGWDHDCSALFAQSERTGLPLTLALLDLDHFKVYNDRHGHQAGDDLLADFADAAADVLRETDLIARWGGEEFALAMPGCVASDAFDILERVRQAVPGAATCTIGYAEVARGESVDECLTRADHALYTAKRQGRDRSLRALDLAVPAGESD